MQYVWLGSVEVASSHRFGASVVNAVYVISRIHPSIDRILLRVRAATPRAPICPDEELVAELNNDFASIRHSEIDDQLEAPTCSATSATCARRMSCESSSGTIS